MSSRPNWVVTLLRKDPVSILLAEREWCVEAGNAGAAARKAKTQYERQAAPNRVVKVVSVRRVDDGL